MAQINANTLRMPTRQQQDATRDERTTRDADEFGASFVAMLNVMRRMFDLWGDPEIKKIIDKAERALARR